MNRVPGIIKMYFQDKQSWMLIPWLWILLPSFAVNWLIALLTHSDVGLYTGGLASLYLSTAAIGMLIVRETFPFAIGFSARRSEYFLGTLLVVLLFCTGSAVLLLLLSLIEHSLIRGWGVNLHFFSVPYVSDGPWPGQFWISFVLLVHLYSLGLMLASVYQRFRRNGLLILGVIALVTIALTFFALTSWIGWGGIIAWFAQHTAVDLASWLALPALLYIAISYLLLRKATI
ncbi:hypothetical protein KDA_71120 [Dictyobacter alpinus]|uniref:Uncharacterized protein n=1 Tax=Dictyobacter alpinus TaxID=2014873 RepID=A0A402BJU7_9CHLR|nr:hypothetical protein [Dictyobacter alpinus]GCE31628.1 hypothetical protein KDA_71120 [Dictyobacter alpinus]